MGSVFMSFLGKGAHKGNGIYDYDTTTYELGGRVSSETKFAQVAEIELLIPKRFERALIVVTPESRALHLDTLSSELHAFGVPEIVPVEINEEFEPRGQWKWFEKIVEHIRSGDRLTVDLTHGYRIMSIVFSNAVNFILKTRQIKLDAVYYAAFEKDRKKPPIIDMRDFFVIHEWADGVSRLVEDADAAKIARLAEQTGSFQFAELNDSSLISAFVELSEKIRNVDLHNVSHAADRVLQIVKSKCTNASPVALNLLHLVSDKFIALTTDHALSGCYDAAYFDLQFNIIELLLEHKLFMQAFTGMREMIGSVGLIENKKAKYNTSKGRDQRKKAEVFISMLQFEEQEWNFSGDRKAMCDKLRPFYEKLRASGAESIIKSFLPDLIKCRNGFDHAWMGQKESWADIERKGAEFFQSLISLVANLKQAAILK